MWLTLAILALAAIVVVVGMAVIEGAKAKAALRWGDDDKSNED